MDKQKYFDNLVGPHTSNEPSLVSKRYDLQQPLTIVTRLSEHETLKLRELGYTLPCHA